MSYSVKLCVIAAGICLGNVQIYFYSNSLVMNDTSTEGGKARLLRAVRVVGILVLIRHSVEGGFWGHWGCWGWVARRARERQGQGTGAGRKACCEVSLFALCPRVEGGPHEPGLGAHETFSCWGAPKLTLAGSPQAHGSHQVRAVRGVSSPPGAGGAAGAFCWPRWARRSWPAGGGCGMM